MHGIIFAELRKYVEARSGGNGWSTLLEKAGLRGKLYMSVGEYPDSEVVALVTAASVVTGHSIAATLEDFGEFITPSLMGMYGHLMKPDWRALDVIENTERTVHSVVRVQDPGAKPPKLRTARLSPEEVILIYDSPRQLCGLAKGIGKGLAKHFNETLLISETRCMQKGASSCEIHFRNAR